MKDIAREFLTRLTTEEEYYNEHLKSDDFGFEFLTALKEFDCYHYYIIRHKSTDDTEDNMQLMLLGLPRLVSAALSAVTEFRAPIISFRSNEDLVLRARILLRAYGVIEQGRRLAHAVMAGELEIQRSGDSQYDIIFPETVYDMEQHEKKIARHYASIRRDRAYAEMREKFGDDFDRIINLMRKNVYVYDEHYMGYDAHLDVDDFFFELARCELLHNEQWNSFDSKLLFGRVPMQKYQLAITFFLSVALKHEKFAETLIEKSPEVQFYDILTIMRTKQLFEGGMIGALNRYGPIYEDGYTALTPKEVQTIMKVLSVRRDNLEVLRHTTSPLPFLIEYSQTAWVTSVAAAQTGATQFLMNSLNHHFKADCDRNQQTREAHMQAELRHLLAEFQPKLAFRNNTKIRCAGRMTTDVDFVAVDDSDGTIILFQLKHQNPYGADIRQRSSKSARLVNEVSHWLDAIRSWRDSEPEALNPTLGLRNNLKYERVYLVVVVKHHAHFISTLDLQRDAAYATWAQLFDVVNRLKSQGEPSTLRALAKSLQRSMSHQTAESSSYNGVDIYRLRELTYRVRAHGVE